MRYAITDVKMRNKTHIAAIVRITEAAHMTLETASLLRDASPSPYPYSKKFTIKSMNIKATMPEKTSDRYEENSSMLSKQAIFE